MVSTFHFGTRIETGPGSDEWGPKCAVRPLASFATSSSPYEARVDPFVPVPQSGARPARIFTNERISDAAVLSCVSREKRKHPMNTTSPQGVDGRIVVA